jgi:hypothetical protein
MGAIGADLGHTETLSQFLTISPMTTTLFLAIRQPLGLRMA